MKTLRIHYEMDPAVAHRMWCKLYRLEGDTWVKCDSKAEFRILLNERGDDAVEIIVPDKLKDSRIAREIPDHIRHPENQEE